MFTILDECFSHHTSSRPCFERLASLLLHVHGYIFHQVERQKLKSEEGTMRLSAEKSRLDRSLNTAEQELQEAQQQILMLQVGNGRWWRQKTTKLLPNPAERFCLLSCGWIRLLEVRVCAERAGEKKAKQMFHSDKINLSSRLEQWA